MPLDETDNTSRITSLMLPRIGATLCGAALLCPALAMPLVIVCLATLGAAAVEEGRADSVVPETPPTKPARRRARRPVVDDPANSTEDSFPASDPPSWTPVTGTGTRH